MEQADLDALLTPRVREAVDAEVRSSRGDDALARSSALRRAGFDPREAATVLTQAALRRRAAAKFGEFAAGMLFTRSGLEQATRLPVAVHHAARFRAAGMSRVADLGCGIGGDALAFAAAGLTVLAVERDPVTAQIAMHNVAPFPEVTVVTGDAADADLADVEAVWLDPARRTAGHSGTRRVGADASSPSLDLVGRLAQRLPVGVKLSPAHDRDDLPVDGEAQWVSAGGDVVELVVWTGALARHGIRRAALLLTDHGPVELTAAADAPDAPAGDLGAFVHEPDGAVIRARLIGDLARATGTRPIGPGIAYLTGDEPVSSPFLTSFAVEAALPFDSRRIRQELRARGIGRLEVKKRGVDLDPAAFRASLGLSGTGEAVLIVTRTAGRRVALVCTRLPHVGADAAITTRE